MLAGETSTILLSAKVSTTLSETLDEAAPMTTDGLPATSVPAEAVETDMSVESPESWTSWQALAPSTPPAALMSETARPTPATSGGPRKARLPVSGRMPPTLNASALVWPDLHLSLVNLSLALPLADSEEEGLCVELLSLASEPESDAAGGEGEAEDGGAGHHSRPCGGGGSIHGVNLSVAWVHFARPAPREGRARRPCHRRTGPRGAAAGAPCR